MRTTKILAASATLVLGFATAAHADLVVNGSFEADPFNSSGGGYSLGLVDNAVTGWFIPASDGTYPWGVQNINAFNAGPAAEGNQWLVLGETGQGGPSTTDYTIQQTINGLIPGEFYSLDFEVASEFGLGTATGEVSFLSGSSFAPTDFSALPAGSTFWNPWSFVSMSFLATSTSATLQFKDLAVENASGGDLGLDNVNIFPFACCGPVPEPITLSLFGAGLAGAVAMRRRKKGIA